MTATILLIRHAPHVDLDHRFSGRLPGIALSAAGRAEAARLGAALAADGIDRVECSPLDRTRDTAQAIADACGIAAIEPVDALIELDMGEWAGRAIGSFGEDPAWIAWNTHRGTARIPGGETMAEAQARIVTHLQQVAAAPDDQIVAVVTHADMIRAAVAHVLGLPLDHLLRFDIDPASVTRVTWGDWGTRLLRLNEKVR